MGGFFPPIYEKIERFFVYLQCEIIILAVLMRHIPK